MKRKELGHLFIGCFLILNLMACGHLAKDFKDPNLTLSDALNLRVKSDTKETVLKKVGNASLVVDLEVEFDNRIWIYRDQKTQFQKMSLVFDSHGRLHSVTWFTSENDPEKDLSKSQKLFPRSSFVKIPNVWENSHAAPFEVDYRDDEQGVVISYNTRKNQVHSISWFDKTSREKDSRTPATQFQL